MKRLLDNVNSHISPAALCSVASCLLLTACASGLRIQTDYVPAGSLRLAQVTAVASQREIVESKRLYEALIGSGINETEIKDGSVVEARIYCCGGPDEQGLARMAYVPTGMEVRLNDIIEIRVGHPPKKGEPGEINTVTQIRQKAGESGGSCRWDPPNERLWHRILYADWMPKEGWVKQGGLSDTWYKPPPAGKP